MNNCNNSVKSTCGAIHQAECTEYQGEINEQSALNIDDCLTLADTTEDIYNQLETLSNTILTSVSVNNIDPDINNNIAIDSDDVPQGSTNLYATSGEKVIWNDKQDSLNGTGVVKSTAGEISYLSDSIIGDSVLTSANPSAITFLRANADNSVSWLNAAAFRTAIGAGTGSANGTVTSVSALTLGTTGTDLNSSVADSTTTPVITLNVPNASATNRGVLTTADWSTFNGKAGLASPAFTGVPTAPTASAGTNTTQLATTAFVNLHSTSGTYTTTPSSIVNITGLTFYTNTYTKVGNIVTAQIVFTFSTAGASNNSFIFTLPFTTAPVTSRPMGTGTAISGTNSPVTIASFLNNTTTGVVYFSTVAVGLFSGQVSFQYSIV